MQTVPIDTIKAAAVSSVSTIKKVGLATEDLKDVHLFASFVKSIDDVSRGVI